MGTQLSKKRRIDIDALVQESSIQNLIGRVPYQFSNQYDQTVAYKRLQEWFTSFPDDWRKKPVITLKRWKLFDISRRDEQRIQESRRFKQAFLCYRILENFIIGYCRIGKFPLQ